MREKDAFCQASIAELAQTLDGAAPDVLIVIGDDQREMFLDDGTPAFGIFHGPSIVDTSPDPKTMHPSIQLAYWAQHADKPEAYPVDARLGTHLISGLVADGFDIAAYAKQPAGRSVGHAFTFVRRRLMRERRTDSDRSDFRELLLSAESADGRAVLRFGARAAPRRRESTLARRHRRHHRDRRALALRRRRRVRPRFLRAFEERTSRNSRRFRQEWLVSGTSELRNWLVLAGALEAFDIDVLGLRARVSLDGQDRLRHGVRALDCPAYGRRRLEAAAATA